MTKKVYPARKPGAGKRTNEQKDVDINFCSDLFLRGYSYREIAVALNRNIQERGFDYHITFQTVHKDLKKLMIEWKKEQMHSIDTYMQQELKKLDKMEVELWAAWEASKYAKKEKTRKSRAGGKDDDGTKRWGDYGYNESTEESRAGNPRYFDLLLDVNQRRARLLGYDAPVKMQFMGGEIKPDEEKRKYDVQDLPPELLFAFVDQLQKAEFSKTLNGIKESDG